jgi:hypothetical protein
VTTFSSAEELTLFKKKIAVIPHTTFGWIMLAIGLCVGVVAVAVSLLAPIEVLAPIGGRGILGVMGVLMLGATVWNYQTVGI